LLPGTALSPGLLDGVIQLGMTLSFPEAATLFTHFTHVPISAETVRRWTERAGVVQERAEVAAVVALEATQPDPPAGPARQFLSADGAMVPLVGGQWAEARLLALGSIETNSNGTPQTTALSYFGRLADAQTFSRIATLETPRCGTATAGTVVAVTDGAAWLQEFIDLHRPDAIRILDFPHALEHLSSAAQAVYGLGTAAASEWLGTQAHTLRHGDPTKVLAALRTLASTAATPEAHASVTRCFAYLDQRRAQITYAEFADRGFPLGSGSVESGHKRVVQARLKGPGMHWTRTAVNAILALRGVNQSGRWLTVWPTILTGLRQWPRRRRSAPPRHRLPSRPFIGTDPAPRPAPPPKLVVNGRPSADHPWRRFRLPGSPHFPPRAK
jgi:hypothetical protein